MKNRSLSRKKTGAQTRRRLGFALTLTLTLAVAARAETHDAVEWVNPYIGTGSGSIGYGGTMPFVTPPFGMTNWTAQTRQNRLSVVSYKFEDTVLQGFIGTHQPAIWMGDYGYLTLVPQVGALETAPEARQMRFSHADEIARPDYYSVWMTAKDGSRLRAEITATERCAYMRFTFPKSASGRVLVEASRPGVAGEAKFDAAKHEITGYNPDRTDRNLGPFALPNFKGYFVVEFRQSWKNAKTYGADSAGSHGAYAEFGAGEVVEARIGTSFLSVEQARENLRKEIPAWDFDGVQKKLRATWNDKLGRISVEGATDDQKKIVYTGTLSRSAVSARLLGVRKILQRLRRQGARGRILHRLLDLGHVSRGEQPDHASRPRTSSRHDHRAAAELQGRRMDAEVAESVLHQHHDRHARRLAGGRGPRERLHRLRQEDRLGCGLQGRDDSAGGRHDPALARPRASHALRGARRPHVLQAARLYPYRQDR